jgi:hypothetical protein
MIQACTQCKASNMLKLQEEEKTKKQCLKPNPEAMISKGSGRSD